MAPSGAPLSSANRPAAPVGDGLGTHLLPARAYTQLATGGGDRETARFLGRAQRSKKLLLLRMVHDALAADPAVLGRLPAPAVAWELLAGAQRADAAAFDAVLMHPSTGVWASRLLRRMRGVTPGDVPLWVEAGHLHALAAAAAIRAGTEFDIKVPVRDGHGVHLPSLGTVSFPGDLPYAGLRAPGAGPGIAAVRRVGGSVAVITPRLSCVLLPDDVRSETRGWRPTPAVRATAGTRHWSVQLDDADPYGPFVRGREVPRLSAQRLRSWQSLLDGAWEMLSRDQPELAGSLAETMRCLIPLAPEVRGEPYSATSPESYGSAMIGLPRTPTSLAVALVHEFQHVKLGALLDLATLCRSPGDEVLYAPWRGDPRPAAGMLQGVYAHVGVTGFWRGRRLTAPEAAATSLAHFEFALWRGGTLRALDDLGAAEELTDLGRDFVARLCAVVAPWCEEPVPEREAADARLLAADHRAMWRLRNTEPSADAVEGLARAWAAGREGPRAGAPEPAASAIRPGVLPAEQSYRARLVKSRWRDPEEFAWWSGRPELSGAPAPDLALVAGEYAAAVCGYVAQVRRRPEASSPWAGLGLALAGLGDDRAAGALLDRPELVRAVWLRHVSLAGPDAAVSPVSPVSLAEWLGSAG